MTYQELKTALDALTPEQLASQAQWCGDDRGGDIVRVWILEEDHGNPSGDGMEPRSAYADDPDALADFEVDYPAGTVFLVSDS